MARSDGLLDPLGGHVSALRQLKPDPSSLIVSLVGGDRAAVAVTLDDQERFALRPSCSTPSGEALPAVRLHDFVAEFPQRNTSVSMCNEDLSDVMVLFADLLSYVLGNPCIEGDIDRDPEAPGIQAECVVSDVRYPGTDRQAETLLPECASVPPATDELPCWHFETDPASCPDTPTQSMLVIERHDYPQPGTHVQARCRILC